MAANKSSEVRVIGVALKMNALVNGGTLPHHG